jgi:5'-AMP-activated protein kinase regulatory beta subunit
MVERIAKKRVTFTLDDPAACEVMLAGSFNAWDPSVRPLKKDTNGLWKTIMMLPKGTYEYRFIVDGQWREDPKANEQRLNEFGSHNSVITI